MSQLHRALIQSAGEPALDWTYRVRMPDLESDSVGTNSSLQNITKLASRDRVIFAESVTVGLPHSASEKRAVNAWTLGYAGTLEQEDVTLSLYETYDYSTTKYLKKWKSLIFNEKDIEGQPAESGNFNLPKDYKKTIWIDVFEPTQFDTPVIKFKATGCWPTDTGQYNYSYGNNGRIIVECTMSTDWVYLETNEQNGLKSQAVNSALAAFGIG